MGKQLLPVLVFMCCSAILWGQPVLNIPVTIHVERTTCAGAISLLEKETGVRFGYSIFQLPSGKNFSLDANATPLGEVLRRLFYDTEIKYEVAGGQIILYKIPRREMLAARVTASGYVRDAATGEPLIGASIYNKAGNTGTSTNEHGFFSIPLPADSARVFVSYLGYQTGTFKAVGKQDTSLQIRLVPLPDTIQEVIIVGDKMPEISHGNGLSRLDINGTRLRMDLGAAGEADLLQHLQQLPGVQGGIEGALGMYVRGGNADQNLVLLDGVPLYNPFHGLGLISVFNNDVIKKATLIKGGFPAKYDERISSVLDVHMKDGNARQFAGELSFGLTLASVCVEGPIQKDKTTFVLAFRRSLIDGLLALGNYAFGEGNPAQGQTRLGYYLLDANAAVTHVFSEKDKLRLSFYGGNEKYSYRYFSTPDTLLFPYQNNETINTSSWNNIALALQWNHQYGPKLFGNITGTFTRYRYRYLSFENVHLLQDDRNSTQRSENVSHIQDGALIFDWDYRPDNGTSWRFGGQATWRRFNVAVDYFSGLIPDAQYPTKRDSLIKGIVMRNYPSDNPLEASLYFEREQHFRGGSTLTIGASSSAFFTKGKTYFAVSPRLFWTHNFKKDYYLNATGGVSTQYLHQPTNSGLSLPSDLWVYSTDEVKPQRAVQVSFGGGKSWKNMWSLSIETYYKRMWKVSRLLPGRPIATPFDPSWETTIRQGDGDAYGAELFFQKTRGKTTGWVSYQLAWAWRQFDDLNNGRPYPFKYDRRHALTVSISHKFGKKISLTANWRFSTGSPWSVAYAYSPILDAQGNPVNLYLFGSSNVRLPVIHRLDIAVSFRRVKAWGERIVQIGLFNAYNRINPAFLSVDQDIDGNLYARYGGLLPILPVFQLTFRFF